VFALGFVLAATTTVDAGLLATAIVTAGREASQERNTNGEL